MSQIFLYRTDKTPAAPSVRMNLSDLTGSSVLYNLDAELDSGAARTIVPAGIVQQLGTLSSSDCEIEVVGGQRFRLPIHRIWLIIQGLSARIEDVAADLHEPEILLGRDVMNQYVIVLDGPSQRVEVSDP